MSAHRLSLLVCIVGGLTGCATNAAIRAGMTAETQQDFDRAVVEYTKVVRDRPDDRTARAMLEQAKLRASQDHLSRGRRLASVGKLDEALLEYRIAGELNPAHASIEEEINKIRTQLRTKIAVAAEGKTHLETLIAESMEAPLPGTELPADITMPDSLIFRDASSRDVFTAIGKFANISVAFDPAFRDQPITVDLRNAKLPEALDAVALATRNFWRVTTQRTVTIIPDTPAKRREYEEEVVRTFYLSNADLKETIDIIRIVVDARRIAMLTATNAITIKDTPDRIMAAGKIISAIDKARPEVIIDVELLEVDRTKFKEYGLQIASPGSPGISGSVDVNREGFTLHDLRNLTQSDVFLTGLPGLYYRLLKTDTATRVLANPQLRTSEGVAAQARFGERVPVPVTTFAPIAAGGLQTQPITSFNYENIGVNIDITPRTHHDDEVSLALRIEVSSISGEGFQGLPTFGNRSINTVIRLRDGETNMLAGLIRDEERDIMSGIPGLSDIPVVGRIFAHNTRRAQETDIILTLTPRIIRVLDLRPEDLQPFPVGRDSGAPIIEVPLPQPAPKPPGGIPEAVPPPPVQTVPPRSPLLPAPPPAPVQPLKPPPPPKNVSPDAPVAR
jgi:general secretion pathway protein D